MASQRQTLRKIYPPGQALFEELLDPDALKKIEEARSDDGFELVDSSIEVQYGCPSCGYEWSGNPKPPRGKK